MLRGLGFQQFLAPGLTRHASVGHITKVYCFGKWLFRAIVAPTMVGFLPRPVFRIFGVSSSGGGLFGRPVILNESGALLL